MACSLQPRDSESHRTHPNRRDDKLIKARVYRWNVSSYGMREWDANCVQPRASDIEGAGTYEGLSKHLSIRTYVFLPEYLLRHKSGASVISSSSSTMTFAIR